MRIVFVIHQFYPEFQSGTERVTLQLARMAQRAGHFVQVLACQVKPSQDAAAAISPAQKTRSIVVDGVPVTLLARASLPASADTSLEVDQTVVAVLEAWLRERQFDVAHVLHSMRMASALVAIQNVGLPMLLTLTDFFLGCTRINLIDLEGRPCPGPDQGRRCTRRCPTPAWTQALHEARHQQAHSLLGAAHALVAPSRYVADRFEAMFPGLKIHVVAHGVDTLAMNRARSVAQPRHGITLGFIGSLIADKGLHVLLQALADQPDLPLRLRVAGAFHGDSVYEARVRKLAAADRRVELMGQCTADQVAELIHGIDLLCLPSLVPESFSLVVHECAAAGVPSLVSDLGAPAQAIGADAGGAVIRAGDVAAWSAMLGTVVREPARLAAWRSQVQLPQRIEEEAFFYESLYRQALALG